MDMSAEKRSARIVVVDDEKALTSLLSEILSMEGYSVECFNDSILALSYCREHLGEIDLIITDQTMPDVSGKQLAEAILLKSPGMPIILCTGFSNQIDEQAATAIGIKAYFDKPLNIGRLTETIDELIAAE